MLSEIIKSLTRKPTGVSLSESIDATPAELISVVKEFGFEGVAAWRDSRSDGAGYRSRRFLPIPTSCQKLLSHFPLSDRPFMDVRSFLSVEVNS